MRGTTRPTMKDVANHAGVSFKTVSRVVNDEPGVSSAVISRVRAAIAELNYRPDDRARTLRSRATEPSTIGFIHADMANPFFTAIHQGLESIALEQGCLILTGNTSEDPLRHDALVDAFSQRRVDGLVVVPVDSADDTGPSPALRAEIDRGTAVVFIDREPDLPGDVVMSDHYGGATIATKHLVANGHRQIAFIGDQSYLYSAAERRRAFLDVLRSENIVDPNVLNDVTTETLAETAVFDLLSGSDPPTALFTAQNYITIGAIRALHKMGLQHQVALVGFDHIEMADVLEPGVSVVPQDATALGEAAGRLLFERLSDPQGTPRRQILPVHLVKRGSGEIPGPEGQDSD